MAHARNMVLWLVAVIVLIAAFAVPSGAEAHAGHAPAGPDRAVASVTPLPASVAAKSIAATSVAAVTTSIATAPVVRASAETGLAHPCDGACCRPGTSCCTGTALAPETHAALPARGPEARAHARALPARTDVVPEALPEPPRSFA
ncbi:hypothetical protein [Methylobacterium sp. J-090]|uniref:hypothetical protein n=1 Tax=Methylobacterium sp. J-090 TaxID=2836666 RepID=UPI001FBB835D|nr:hypothetical protein [Methylobacterium sp. J-090]MCJ2083379.1 hypothetical protein [Methylobacterium sp. J-090]